MSSFLAIGLGEILWDVLPEGKKLGGAPANFAYHVNQLGGTGIPVSRIGDDANGHEALSILVDNGLNIDAISIDPTHPTGTVDACVDENGVATYTFPDDVAWDFIEIDDEGMALASKADAICFGTLAQRSPNSRKAIQAFLKNAPNALKIYDINLRQDFYSSCLIRSSLKLANVLKINDDELRMVTEMFSLPKGEHRAMSALLKEYDLKLAVLTRGSEGSLIISPDEMSDLPGKPTDVVDTIGAGDAFTAAMTMAYLNGKELDEINRYATSVAAYVCCQVGAMPKMTDDLKM